MDKKMPAKYKYFLFLLWILMLQALRNVNMIIYTGVLLSAYVMLFFKFPINNRKILKSILLWLLLYLAMPMISILNGISVSELTTALIRYLAILPLVIWGISYLEVFHDYTKEIIRVFILVTVFSAILMVYQFFWGKISIFAEVTERVGYSRYSSLLGSPTSYGTLAPLALLALSTWNLFSGKWKIVFQILIIVGGALSLSKAFFVNLVVCIGLLMINIPKVKKSHNSKLLFKIIGVLFLIGILGIIIFNTAIGDYFIKMLNYSFNDEYNGVNADLINRLTELPRIAFEYHDLSLLQYLFGVGFKGYSGVLGLSEYPMCHNDYFSLVLAQGLVFFVVIMVLYIRIICRCIKNKSEHSIFSFKLVIYILINMLAGQWNYLTTFNMIFLLIIMSELRYVKRPMKNQPMSGNLLGVKYSTTAPEGRKCE